MKNKRQELIITFIFIGAAIASYSNSWSIGRKIELKVALEKESYLVDEPVFVEIVAENISQQDVYALPLTLGSSLDNFKIIVRNASDKVWPYKGAHHYTFVPNGYQGDLLKPGEKKVLVKDLLEIFGEWGDPYHQVKLYLPPGEYSVQVVYQSDFSALMASREKTGENILKSQILTFRVTNPIGSELQAQQEILEIVKRYLDSNEPKYHLDYQNFIKKYPKSVYLPVAFDFLTYLYTTNIGFQKKKQKLIEDAIELFYDSLYSYQFFTVLVHTIYHHRKEQETNKRCLIDEVKESYPGTKVDFYLTSQIEQR